MYYVGCEACGKHLTKEPFATYAEAEAKRIELGHQIPASLRNGDAAEITVCRPCLNRHTQRG